MDIVNKLTPKKQHYVPQFLLKNFAIDNTEQLYTYDKLADVFYKTSVKDSACENGFYNIKIDGKKLTYEHKLSKLETSSNNIIKIIINNESIQNLDTFKDHHMILCFFVSSLLLRTNKQREIIQQLSEFIRKFGRNHDDTSNYKELSKEEVKTLHVTNLIDHIFDAANIFSWKAISLLKAPEGASFIISDNPVVMYGHKKNRLKSKGYAVDGVEVFLPISKKLCLSFMCPKLIEEILQKYTFIQNNKHIHKELNDYDTDGALEILKSIATDKAFQISETRVKFINSLQVFDSYNRIYSSSNDFEHAKEIISKNPHLKNNILIDNELPD